MSKKIAVLTTSDVFNLYASGARQEPVAQTTSGGRVYPCYSTGILERAIALGYEVFVVTTRSQFGPHDEWWKKLVPADHIVMTVDTPAGFIGRDSPDTRATWRRAYDLIGLPWDEGFQDWCQARVTLYEKHGVPRPRDILMGGKEEQMHF